MCISCLVRSNANHKIGFVGDEQRVNVALTRSRLGLFVVGDADTLRSSTVWDSWLDQHRERYEGFVAERTYDAFVQEVGDPGTWGDHDTSQEACNL